MWSNPEISIASSWKICKFFHTSSTHALYRLCILVAFNADVGVYCLPVFIWLLAYCLRNDSWWSLRRLLCLGVFTTIRQSWASEYDSRRTSTKAFRSVWQHWGHLQLSFKVSSLRKHGLSGHYCLYLHKVDLLHFVKFGCGISTLERGKFQISNMCDDVFLVLSFSLLLPSLSDALALTLYILVLCIV